VERLGYNKADFAHGPKWVFHDEMDAKWMGFDAIRLEFKPEMCLVPLPGHTRGHCGVAVRVGDGWLFHCADALPTNARYDLLPYWIQKMVIGPHVPRLKAFAAAHPEVRMLAGHMDLAWFEQNA
jgi:glyoxylase-like metal-dependent hydrolase (beta-lactamase superfamily II)